MKIYTYKISHNPDHNRDLNVVIPTHTIEKTLFKKAKKSVEEAAKHVQVNVTLNAVVDSGPDFRFSRSVNRGLEETEADFYLNMNDDLILDKKALFYSIQDFDEIPNLGLLGALLFYPNGKVQHLGIEIKKCNSFWKLIRYMPWYHAPFYSLNLWKIENELIKSKVRYNLCSITHTKLKNFKLKNIKGVVGGAYHIFTRYVYLKTKGYDENYIMGTEDVDFCLMVMKLNKHVRLDTRVRGIHYGHGSGKNYGVYQRQRKKYYYKKWHPDEILKLIEWNGQLVL